MRDRWKVVFVREMCELLRVEQPQDEKRSEKKITKDTEESKGWISLVKVLM